MPDQTFGQQLGMQAANQAASNIMGIIMGGFNDQRQLDQQAKLNEQNKGMIDYNYMKQLQMWKDTNYSAQIEELKKAHLNPALMYGMRGGGGTTTGTGAGTQAPHAPQGGGELIAAQGMGIQYQLLEAQKRNINADTKLKEADAANRPLQGANITASTESITQGIQNAKAAQELTKVHTRIATIDERIKGESADDSIDYIKWQAQKALKEIESIGLNNQLNADTIQDKKRIIAAEAVGAVLRNELTRAQTSKTQSDIEVNKAQINKMAYDILHKAMELSQGVSKISQEDQKIAIQKLLSEYTTTHPSLGQVTGKTLEAVQEIVADIIGTMMLPVHDPKLKK